MPWCRSWRTAGGDRRMTQHINAVSRLVRSLSSQLTKDPHHLAGARARSWISTVAVLAARKSTIGGNAEEWMGARMVLGGFGLRRAPPRHSDAVLSRSRLAAASD